MHQLSTHISASHLLPLGAASVFACEWRGCPQAAAPVPSYRALVSHLCAHTGNRSYLCPVPGCAKVYKRSDFLAKHIAAHGAPAAAAAAASDSDSDAASDASLRSADSDAHAAMLVAQLAYIRSQVAARKLELARYRTRTRRLRLENDILVDALAQQQQ